jgi:glutathione S-transferase
MTEAATRARSKSRRSGPGLDETATKRGVATDPAPASTARAAVGAALKRSRTTKPTARRTTARSAALTISSRNYSSWSLRGWLLVRFAGLDCETVTVSPDDPDARKELLLLAPSIRVPCLTHDGARVWNTLAIAEYLDEVVPTAAMLPKDRVARAHCRSISGEMNSGFANLRAALPMNLKAHHPKYRIWAGAQPDIDRIVEIWTECLVAHGGPYLYGVDRTMADAMFAPVATRFLTYDVALPAPCLAYCRTIMAMPEMREWVEAARAEPDDIEELEMDF